MELDILLENEDLVVINKPAGLVVHSDGKTKEDTLVLQLLKKYPLIRDVGEPWKNPNGVEIPRPGIVHRLDRETSGVLVVAKTQAAFSFLKEQFQQRKVKKVYLAFVYGVLKKGEGIIDFPIGKSKKDFRLRSAQRGARGELREAITTYRVLEHGPEVSYVEVCPQTGRTHQLRVHFKAVHHPIVCDKLYAPKRPCLLGFKRLALHAHALSFATPSGERVTVEAALPQDFERALSAL